MSCESCDQIQTTPETNACYARIGEANVLISGCRTHLADLLAAIRYAASHESEWKSRDNGTIGQETEE